MFSLSLCYYEHTSKCNLQSMYYWIISEIIELSQDTNIKDVFETYIITTVYCNISASEIPCTIIWNHSFICIFENETESGDKVVGFCTESYAILNVSRSTMPKIVTCILRCGDLNVTSKSLRLKMPVFHG